ncbi:hypothetical protein K2W90_00065 [Candidatus Babeliales bacterium]|nr:hypothetical protein [Candidatus Babeliales bacterium]
MKKIRVISVLALALVPVLLSAKQLTSPEMHFLNMSFQTMPYVAARIKLSKQKSKAVLADLRQERDIALVAVHDQVKNKVVHDKKSVKNEHEEKALILTRLQHMIHPIQEFFNEVRNYSGIVLSLIKESFPENKSKDLYITKFLNGQDKDIAVYFAREITTKKQLASLAKEFTILFTNIEDSMSQEAQEAYQQFVTQLKSKKTVNTQVVPAAA